MTEEIKNFANIRASRSKVRLGYVPLADCAPIVMAEELDLFKDHGLEVSLSREIGWAAVRDKVVRGELDASQAVAGLPFATTLGLGGPQCHCLTGMVLNLQGNAITLSSELWARGVRDAHSLRDTMNRVRGRRPLTLGVVSFVSAHHFLFRRWLMAGGIDAERDVRFVVLPPAQMPDSLRAGNLDGFCVGEPWNSVAVAARVGWIAELGSAIARRHPEKVLMVRHDFAEERADEHEALIAALLRSCEYCHTPENHDHVISVLARPGCLHRAEERLRPSYSGVLDAGFGHTIESHPFIVFAGDIANEPTAEKGAWVLNELRACGALPIVGGNPSQTINSVFRYDIFQRAKNLAFNSKTNETSKTELLTCA